ncbi:CRISPR-associated CARF protein Csa3 [Methanobrevibacter filiformis]|uniref:Sugar-specific transcriptional regulator TrmB n=1 Tax=Methanobrevibacter filiformis TaxID=55758 RepID=A0A166ADW6_9EURY|nr:CRISPR-associated CARF protein Csa3 [Methanobrevibacter filiformis]KZX11909.1 sugar-specific transcriptional regulator TrmB [Methanobrevibacter filiformis]
MENILISTIHDAEPLMISITKFSPKKVVLLTEDNESDVIRETRETLSNVFGRFIDIQFKEINSKDIVKIGIEVSEIIDQEKDSGNRIVLNISSSIEPQILGILFGSYTKHQFVDRIFYVNLEDNEIVDLPILRFGISKTKKEVLLNIIDGNNSVKKLSEAVGISRGMAYNHIRELRDMGLIKKDSFEITSAGELAIIN